MLCLLWNWPGTWCRAINCLTVLTFLCNKSCLRVERRASWWRIRNFSASPTSGTAYRNCLKEPQNRSVQYQAQFEIQYNGKAAPDLAEKNIIDNDINQFSLPLQNQQHYTRDAVLWYELSNRGIIKDHVTKLNYIYDLPLAVENRSSFQDIIDNGKIWGPNKTQHKNTWKKWYGILERGKGR